MCFSRAFQGDARARPRRTPRRARLQLCLPAPAPQQAQKEVRWPANALLAALRTAPDVQALLSLSSQPPEFLEESTAVSANAPAHPAERCPAAHSAAGDRQGEPGAAAGEAHRLDFYLTSRSNFFDFLFCCFFFQWLLQEISRHQEQFIQMLNEPNPEPVPGGGGGAAATAATAAGMAGGAPGENPMRYIQVTAQEKEAIERVRRPNDMSPACCSSLSNLTFPSFNPSQGDKHETQIGFSNCS